LRILNLDENPNKQDKVEVCLSLGHASIKLKDYPRAIIHYRQALELFDSMEIRSHIGSNQHLTIITLLAESYMLNG
jgi:tetratricopeptide (TPR) repeat protein